MSKKKTDKPVVFERKYKVISPTRLLDLDKAHIEKVAPDEIAVQIMDSKDYYITNYSRCIRKLDCGKCTVLSGVNQGTEDWSYSIVINQWWLGRFRDMWVTVNAYELSVQTFIVNYDMRHTARIWHTGGDVSDGYYRHLYPVTEIEYGILSQLVTSGGLDTDEVVMNVINQHHFDGEIQKKWFVPTAQSHGYLGCSRKDIPKNGSNMKWNQCMVRCFSEKFKDKNPCYVDATCGDEMLNYSNFELWFRKYEQMIGDKKYMDLESDLLSDGEKLYDFEHCVILPHWLNTMICVNRSTNKGNPIGVCWVENAQAWLASGSFFGNQKQIGLYKTAEEAAQAYKDYKEQFVRKITKNHEGKISAIAYDRLMNWKVDPYAVMDS